MEYKSSHKYLWLTLILVVTVIFVSIYAASQQILRLDANDPQIQIAQDAATALNSGQQPSDVVSGKVDINTSLSPFLIVFDKAGNVLAGNGYKDNALPNDFPFGSLSASSKQTYNAVTWQPYTNLRIASVSVAANDYYVMSGRSLAQVEVQENKVLQIVALGWLVCLFVILLMVAIYKVKTKKKVQPKAEKKHKLKKSQKKYELTDTTAKDDILAVTRQATHANHDSESVSPTIPTMNAERVAQHHTVESPHIQLQPQTYIQVQVREEG